MHSVHIPGIKLSHAIFMSYYTGANYLSEPAPNAVPSPQRIPILILFGGVSDVTFWTSRRLKEDNLFASMFRSSEEYKLIYLGKDQKPPSREMGLNLDRQRPYSFR